MAGKPTRTETKNHIGSAKQDALKEYAIAMGIMSKRKSFIEPLPQPGIRQ